MSLEMRARRYFTGPSLQLLTTTGGLGKRPYPILRAIAVIAVIEEEKNLTYQGFFSLLLTVESRSLICVLCQLHPQPPELQTAQLI